MVFKKETFEVEFTDECIEEKYMFPVWYMEKEIILTLNRLPSIWYFLLATFIPVFTLFLH